MPESSQVNDQHVLRFILERIDSVPHLEALLLLWNTRPKPWSADDLARRLYVDRRVASGLLEDLVRNNLIVKDSARPNHYLYESKPTENDRLVEAVYAKYRVEVVAISTVIHSKTSSALRDFADAFRFKKERD